MADTSTSYQNGNGSGLDPSLPHHIAIIMDGNGRWARQRNLLRYEGHRAGVQNIRKIVEACAANRVPYLTVYAFSTENWSRPSTEVQALLGLLAEAVDSKQQSFMRRVSACVIWGALTGWTRRSGILLSTP